MSVSGYSQAEQALIALVVRTYGVPATVNMATELGDLQKTDGRWVYRDDHVRFQAVFQAHYGFPLERGWVYRKTAVWELWDLIEGRCLGV